VDEKGVARYPVGQWPILDPETGDVLIDDVGRRSYVTSIAFGPSIGKNIALGYLPKEYAQEGRTLMMEYFHERYPIRVEAVGYRALYDPDNERLKS
jgi:glycine cleavage system aminomethyltransferase T